MTSTPPTTAPEPDYIRSPSKARAQWAFALSVLGCAGLPLIASAVLAVQVLRKGRDGYDRGQGLAIVALTLDVVWVAGIATVVALGLGGSLDPTQDHRPPGPVTSTQQVRVSELRAGDCFDLDDASPDPDGPSGAVPVPSIVQVVPCSVAHDQEVFALTTLGTGSYPGVVVVQDQAGRACAAAFGEWEGVAATRSRLQESAIYPTAYAWDTLRQHTATCVTDDPTGRTTGSLRDKRI